MNTDNDTEEQLRLLLQTGLREVTVPPHLAARSVAAARRIRRRRAAATAVAAVAVLAATTTLVATHPWADIGRRVEQLAGQPPALPGPGAANSTLEQVAKRYAVERLGLPITRTLGSRRGGKCAVYDLRDSHGVSHRVVLILEADEPAYEPVYISQAFDLQEFVPDSDDACGMRSSNSLRRVDTAGTEVPIGPA